MDSLSDKFSERIEWLKKQFRRPLHCRNKYEIDNETALATSKLDDSDAEEDNFDESPCYEPEIDIHEDKPQSTFNVQEPCCRIKMQNPYEVYPEREEKIIFPPCPPKTYSQNPRDPTCKCEACQKNNGKRKCCEQKKSTFVDKNKTIGKLEHA